MNKAYKDKLIEALRSGKYKKGTSVLRSKDRFCVLGVLCDISGKGSWEDLSGEGSIKKYVVGQSSSAGNMPAELAKEVGLTYNDQVYLASLNDSGKTFDQLATIITVEF